MSRHSVRLAQLFLAGVLTAPVFLAQGVLGRSNNAPALPPPSGMIVNVSTEAQLQTAVDNLASHTTVLIAPGRYTLTRSLTIKNTVTDVAIRGASDNSDDVVLAGTGMTHPSYDVPYGIWTGGDVQDITIANLTIRDISDVALAFSAGTQRPIVHNVHLIDAGRAMVVAAGDGPSVDGGLVEYSIMEYTTTAKDTHANAMVVQGGQGWVVRKNVFQNIVGPSRQLTGPAVVFTGVSTDTLVDSNWFINNSSGVALGATDGDVPDHIGGIVRNNFVFRAANVPGETGIAVNNSPFTQVLNNTLFLSGTYGTPIEYRYAGSHDLVIWNNLLGGAIWARDGATGVESDNLGGASTDMFVDAAAGDLHLRSTAYAAIDRGIESGSVTDDIDGQLRPVGLGYDIGAAEFGAGVPGRIGTAAVKYVTIEGRVVTRSGDGMDGVVVTAAVQGAGVYTVRTSDGSFRFSGLTSGQTVTVTAAKAGYSFTPASRVYASLSASVSSAYFFASASQSQQPSPQPSTMTISLVSPSNGSSFKGPGVIPVIATVTSPSSGGGNGNGRTSTGTIGKMATAGVTKVDFYANSTYIGSDTSSPYTVNWSNGQAGTYALKAIATDTSGATLQSPSVTVVIAPESVTPPSAPPSVALTSPSAGSSFTAPATITVSATATSTTSTIAKVEFYSGSTLIGTDTSAPYSVAWSGVGAGSYSLSAVATDAAGGSTHSSTVPVTVTAAAPAPPPPAAPIPAAPVVSLVAPTTGSSYQSPATITLTANASSASGTITRVDFYAGSTLIGTDTASPFTFVWSNVPAGAYTLTAVATNNVGVATTSAAAAVTVSAAAPAPAPAPAPAGPLPAGGLVQAGNLAYQGAFRVPAITVAGNPYAEFDYGGTAPAFNPAHNSLFLVSHMYTQMTAELGIPASLGTGPVSSLPTATALHTFVDALGGKLHSVAPDPSTTVYIGGQYVYAPGQMVVSAYTYYAGSPTASHFSRSTDLNSAAAAGPFNISAGIGPWAVSFVSGYMGGIPAAWQAALGGPALTGDCCLGVVSRTSYGPAAFAFDPANLTPTAAQPLVYYDGGGDPTHATLGNWVNSGPPNPLYNSSSVVTGVVFPEGSSSVLFFGTQGLGPACYGPGGSGAGECVDPEGSAKGVHGYPYVYYVWAYDAHDLAAVHAGAKKPWEVKPYAVWSLNLPYAPNGQGHHMGGAAYDPATGRIFISQQFADGDGPVIHVFTIK
jgi:hypothetical protein